jgi:MYXO-CTERM domain-containing protein
MNYNAVLWPVASLTLVSLLCSPASAADEPGRRLFGAPVVEAPELSEQEQAQRRADFEAMIEERGWRVEGDVVGPAELFAAPDPQATQAAEWQYEPHRATIFLNFFGGPMTPGTNSAKMQSTCLKGGTLEYPGFNGTEAQALAIIETFQSQLAPYGVRLAYEQAPPPELPYAMVMMGGTPGLLGMQNGVLGVSCSSDCGDRWWRDATFAFTAAASASQTNTLATTALHEAAHAFGLAHIDKSFNSGYIMHPYVDQNPRVWAKDCIGYNDATGGINCQSTHDIFCGGGAQNTHAELLAYFGVNGPDTEAPTVSILTPTDGQELPAGTDISIEADITDNFEGVGWKLLIYQDGNLIDERPAFVFERKWGFSKLPAGTYRFVVQAIDHDRNIGADEVTIFVGNATPPETGSDTDSSGGTDGTGGTGDTAGTGGVTGLTGGTGGTAGATDTATDTAGIDEDDGCGCTSAPRPADSLWLLTGLLGLFARRRR